MLATEVHHETAGRVGCVSEPHHGSLPWRLTVPQQLPPLTAVGRRQRAALANARRLHPGAPETEEIARSFRATRLADYIRAQVDAAPPLTVEQREELARILRPAATAGGDAA